MPVAKVSVYESLLSGAGQQCSCCLRAAILFPVSAARRMLQSQSQLWLLVIYARCWNAGTKFAAMQTAKRRKLYNSTASVPINNERHHQ